MTTLVDYDRINVHLIDTCHGCIPWSIEWMIRHKGYVTKNWEIQENDLDGFQRHYNLYRKTNGRVINSFETILRQIIADYPGVDFVHCTDYGDGQAEEKYQRIDDLIGQGIPCITTIRLLPQDDAHIVPVVVVNPDDINVIWNIDSSGGQQIKTFQKNALYRMHNEGRGTAFMYLP